MLILNPKNYICQLSMKTTVRIRIICAIITWIWLFFSNSVISASTKPYEYEVKAAFIYNFAKFIDWPDSSFESATSPFYVGVLGKNRFNGYLEKILSGKKLKGRKIQIRYFKNFKEVKYSHILFISSSEKKRLRHVFKALEKKGILTIGDTEGFISTGGAIGFVMKDNKVRFEINLNSARKARLTISSKLLRLAKKVIDEAGKGEL